MNTTNKPDRAEVIDQLEITIETLLEVSEFGRSYLANTKAIDAGVRAKDRLPLLRQCLSLLSQDGEDAKRVGWLKAQLVRCRLEFSVPLGASPEVWHNYKLDEESELEKELSAAMSATTEGGEGA